MNEKDKAPRFVALCMLGVVLFNFPVLALFNVAGAVFGEIRPATSMVEVSHLIAPEMLVEIEADAWLGK